MVDVISVPVLGDVTAQEWHIYITMLMVFLVITLTPLRAALRLEFWYGLAGAVSGTAIGYGILAVLRWFL